MVSILKKIHPEGIYGFATVFYDRISRTRAFQKHYELIAEDLATYYSQGAVLDVGTGPGWLLYQIHRQIPDLRLAGVDISKAMVKRAKKNMARVGLENVTLKKCDSDQLPFEDQTFNVVVSSGSIHHWKHPVEELDEIFRILQPGGYALIYDLVADPPRRIEAEAARRFGRFPMMLLWIHSFEEPFYSQSELQQLAGQTKFKESRLTFAGLFCGLIMQKPQ